MDYLMARNIIQHDAHQVSFKWSTFLLFAKKIKKIKNKK